MHPFAPRNGRLTMQIAGLLLALIAPYVMVAIFRRLPWPHQLEEREAEFEIPKNMAVEHAAQGHPHAA